MTFTSIEPPSLDVEDFRRLGVRPNELRLAVIRQAAARATLGLAKRQLTSPSPELSIELSRAATSAYRLLDPRQRSDTYHRAHVGRILPNTLSGAGQTSFFGRPQFDRLANVQISPSPAFESDPNEQDDTVLIEQWLSGRSKGSTAKSAPIDENDLWIRTLADQDLLRTTPLSRRISRWRRRVFNPWAGLSAGGLIVGTVLGLFTLLPNLNRATFRLVDREAPAAQRTEDLLMDFVPPLAAAMPPADWVATVPTEPAPTGVDEISAESTRTEPLRTLQPIDPAWISVFGSLQSRVAEMIEEFGRMSSSGHSMSQASELGQGVEPENSVSNSTRSFGGLRGRLWMPSQSKDAASADQLVDSGIHIDYDLDMSITPAMISTVASRVGRPLAGSIIRVSGDFVLDAESSVVFSVTSAKANIGQAVLVDGQRIDFDPLDPQTKFTFEAGRHHVQWSLDVSELSEQRSLGIHDADFGRRITMLPVADGPTDVAKRFTVAFLRGGG